MRNYVEVKPEPVYNGLTLEETIDYLIFMIRKAQEAHSEKTKKFWTRQCVIFSREARENFGREEFADAYFKVLERVGKV